MKPRRRRAPLAGWPVFLLAVALAACAGESADPTPSRLPATATPTAVFVSPTAAVPTPTSVLPSPAPPPSPTPAVDIARVVVRGSAARRSIALTFDAGADAGYTADILTTLRDGGVRATFSLTGAWAEQNRDLLFSIAADGHQIMNHSYSHASFTGHSTDAPPLTFEERVLELDRTERTIYRYTSRTTLPFFRPPYGDYDDSVRRDIAANGYTAVVMWTIDTRGWAGASVDEIVERTLGGAEPGAIVVLHVGSDSQDAAALPRLIDGLRAAGYAFETVADIVTG